MKRITEDIPDWIGAIIRETTCEYCGMEIVFAKTRKGIGVFDKDSWSPHRLTCPYAAYWSKFAKKRKGETRQTNLEDFKDKT